MEWENIKFKFWMNKGNLKQYASFLDKWFSFVSSLLIWPVEQFDLEVSPLFVVDLLAWERDIERFKDEPEWLYRRRVKFAYSNAADSGTVKGFKNIAERLGLGVIEIDERIAGRDWDVVGLSVSESTIAENETLLDVIVEQYGLTCRQYEWTTKATVKAAIKIANTDYESASSMASIYIDYQEPENIFPSVLGVLGSQVENKIELGPLGSSVIDVIELGAL